MRDIFASETGEETLARRRNATIRVTRLADVKNEIEPPVSGTMEELMGLAWQLTVMTCELGGKYDAKQRLQRNIVRVIKPES